MVKKEVSTLSAIEGDYCVHCGAVLEAVYMHETNEDGIKTGYMIVCRLGCPRCLTEIVTDSNYRRIKVGDA